jgi:hypothetical protein
MSTKQPALSSPECLHAFRRLLEKYSFYDLKDALIRSHVDLTFFHALPIHNFEGGVSHAQVVLVLIEELGRHGLLRTGDPATSRIFHSLLELRPRLYGEINAVATRFFGIGVVPIDPDTEEVTPVRLKPGMLAGDERRRLVEEIERLSIRRSNLPENARESEDFRLKINAISREIHATGGVTRGQLVAGTILDEVIASGSFGTVWRAHSAASGLPRATKVFHLDKLSQGLMLARFRRSIQTIRLLTGDPRCPPSIIHVNDVASDGLAFSMDLAERGSLESMRKYKWPLPVLLAKFRKICEACHFAHEKGVIHRDIKPSNILLDDDLEPVLIDFDISDATTSRIDYLGASTQGWLGTPVFGAPEQLIDARSANRQSDIFSLGRLLHFMLLDGTSPGMITEHEPNLEDLSAQPSTLVEIVRKATRYDPRRRYASVTEIIDDIDRYQTGLAALRVRFSRSYRWVRRHRTPVGILLAALAAAISIWRYLDGLERQRFLDAIQIVLNDCEKRASAAERSGAAAELAATYERREQHAEAPLDLDTSTALLAIDHREAFLREVLRELAVGEATGLIGLLRTRDDSELHWRRRLPDLPPPPSPAPCPAFAPAAVRTCPAITPSARPVAPKTGPHAPTKPVHVSLPEKLPLTRETRELPRSVMDRIEKECASKAWPMISFAIRVHVLDGVATPSQHYPEDPHPAIDCALEIFKNTPFDASGLSEKPLYLRRESLENPDAPSYYKDLYRRMEHYHRNSEQLEQRGKAQPRGPEQSRILGDAHDEALRAAMAAKKIADGVLDHRRTLPEWELHYATIAKIAVQRFIKANKNKDLQFQSYERDRDYHPECALDLNDAWQLASAASTLLGGSSELGRYFTDRAREYQKYQGIKEKCAPAPQE